MPKVPVLNRQVVESAAPVGAEGSLKFHEDHAAGLAQDALGAIEEYAKEEQKRKKLADNLVGMNALNNLDARRREMMAEARTNEGLNATGVQSKFSEEFMDSEEFSAAAEAIEGIEDAQTKVRLSINLNKMTGTFSSELGGWETEQVHKASKRIAKARVDGMAQDFQNMIGRKSGARSLAILGNEVYEMGKLSGLGEKTSKDIALKEMGRQFNVKLKRLISDDRFIEAEELLNNLKRDFNEATGDPEVRGPDIVVNGGRAPSTFKGLDVLRNIGDINALEIKEGADAERIYDRISAMNIPEGEKLKMAYKASKKPKVVTRVRDALSRRMRDFQAADKAAREERFQKATDVMVEKVSKGGGIDVFELAKTQGLSLSQINQLRNSHREWERDDAGKASRFHRLARRFRGRPQVLESFLTNRSNAASTLADIGPHYFRELQAMSKKATPKDAKAGMFYTEAGIRRTIEAKVRASKEIGGLELSAKAFDKEVANFQLHTDRFLTQFFTKNGRRPTRGEVDAYIDGELAVAAKPGDGYFSSTLKALGRGAVGLFGLGEPEYLKTDEGQPAGYRRPVPGSAPPPVKKKPGRWKTNRTLVIDGIKKNGLPSYIYAKASPEELDELYDALAAGDQSAIAMAVEKLKKYAR